MKSLDASAPSPGPLANSVADQSFDESSNNSPSDAQLRALIRSIRRKSGGESARFIGFRVPQSRGDRSPADSTKRRTTLDVDGDEWIVEPVRSSLEARRALLRTPQDKRAILLSACGEQELGRDVVARLALRRLVEVHPWDAVRDAFEASQLDPRIVRDPWMATAVLDALPAGGCAPAPNGFLDLETAWSMLLPRVGLPNGSPTVSDLLDASRAGGFSARLNALPRELRAQTIDRIALTSGRSGAAMLRAVEAGAGDRLEALGVILHLLRTDALAFEAAAAQARGRLVAYGVRAKDDADFLAWANATRDRLLAEVESGRRAAIEPVLRNAERILHEIDAEELAGHSDLLPSAFDHRLDALASALEAIVRSPQDPEHQATLEACWHALAAHVDATAQGRRAATCTRARMALRIARWLGTATPQSAAPASLSSLAQRYIDEGAWVDRAREFLLAGESSPRFVASCDSLAEAADARREILNREFGEALAKCASGDAGTGVVLLLEDVLDQVVARLAGEKPGDKAGLPVLLIVMDGMNHTDLTQLAEDRSALGSFRRAVPRSVPRWPPVIAPLPSITEACRASLLSATLACGGQQVELDGFEAVATRHRWRNQRKKPILFHKGELTGGGQAISAEVREAIDSTARVVTVVVNAIDDHLTKGGQVRANWSDGGITPLRGLLDAAAVARRAVVMVADHGHVVEARRSRRVASEESSDRWRSGAVASHEGEAVFQGPRVLKPRAGGPIVAPWSERIRYGTERAGYHGGATPQEVVAPLAVWIPAHAFEGELEKRWEPDEVPPPRWWDRSLADLGEILASEVVPMPPLGRFAAPSIESLYEPGPIQQGPPHSPAGHAPRPWIDAVLGSELFSAQERSVRRSPSRDEVARLLAALDSGRDVRSVAEIQIALDANASRAQGVISAAMRLLNVDGYPVLSMTESDRTVRLNRELLRTQFGIEVPE